jgi:hypothetical protein
MSTINQGYNDIVRYILQNQHIGSVVVTEPVGWDSDDKEYSRDDKYHGVFVKMSNNLKFIENGYETLKFIYEIGGINEDIRLVKEEKHPKTDIWTRVYDGYLDMSTYVDENKTISIKFNSGGIEKLLKSRESEKVEIDRETTIDGKQIPPLDTKIIELEPRRIFLKSKLKADNTRNYTGHFSRAGDTGSYSSGIPFDIVNKSHEELQDILYDSAIGSGDSGGPHNGMTGMMFFALSDKERVLKVKLDISFKFALNILNESWGNYQINLTRYANGASYTAAERINIFHLPNIHEMENANGRTFFKTIEIEITVGKNESLALESRLRFDLRNVNASQNTARIECMLTDVNGSLTVDEDSFFEKTTTKIVLAHELADRLVAIATNRTDAFYSDFLGRTDIGYPIDGKASLTGAAHGFWVRGFDKLPIPRPAASGIPETVNLFKPFTTSFKDYIASMTAVWNVGVGIEKIGFRERVRVEDLSYFYNRNTTIRLTNQVQKVKRSVSVSKYYSSLEFGSIEGGNYEEAVGLDEYNGQSNFTTIINRLNNVYSQISTYRKDSYGLEFARRKPVSLNDTEDTAYDSSIWLLDLFRNPYGIFEQRLWFNKYDRSKDDFEQSPTGVFSPETATNLRFSPFNCLLRHSLWFSGGLTKNVTDYVRYASSSANSQLKTKLAGGNEYAENGNIINSELPRARYVPEIIEFEHEVSFEISQKLQGKTIVLGKEIQNVYGCVQFINENNEIEKGFLMNLKPNGNGKWKLLKVN